MFSYWRTLAKNKIPHKMGQLNVRYGKSAVEISLWSIFLSFYGKRKMKSMLLLKAQRNESLRIIIRASPLRRTQWHSAMQ